MVKYAQRHFCTRVKINTNQGENGSKLHKEKITRRVNFAQRQICTRGKIAQRQFCREDYFSTRVKKTEKKDSLIKNRKKKGLGVTVIIQLIN